MSSVASETPEGSCPICRGSARRLRGPSAPHPIFSCDGCSHRFASAKPSELEALYGQAYDGFAEDPLFEKNVRSIYEKELERRLPSGAAVLDVGCGNGTTLRVAESFGYKARGVDISLAAVDHCTRLGLTADVMNFVTEDVGGPYDLVTFWDVLEHLIEPRAFIDAAARSLRPGGFLLVKVPGHGRFSVSASATVPRLSRSLLATPAHLQFFTRKSLKSLLSAHFSRVEWVDVGPLRQGARSTGSVRKRAARAVLSTLRTVSGDGTLLAIACRNSA